jgi:hypothetical protein
MTGTPGIPGEAANKPHMVRRTQPDPTVPTSTDAGRNPPRLEVGLASGETHLTSPAPSEMTQRGLDRYTVISARGSKRWQIAAAAGRARQPAFGATRTRSSRRAFWDIVRCARAPSRSPIVPTL